MHLTQGIKGTNANSANTTVCICTHRRPMGLRRLLDSLTRQIGAPPFNVVVVDNDPHGSARPVADAYSDRLAIRYIADATRCLATIRNRSVREADGAFLAFADDDEEVPGTWLAAHHRVLQEFGAEASGGATRFAFDDRVPRAIRMCRIFQRTIHPTGDVLPWFLVSTGNVCVRRAALPHPTEPFSAHFGTTGGEDIACFRAIAEAGGRILAAGPEACVSEFREYGRARYAWVLRRAIRNGGNMADMEWKAQPPARRLNLALRALDRAIRDGATAIRVRRRNPLRYVEKSIDACEQLGRVLCVFGYRYPEYKSPQ